MYPEEIELAFYHQPGNLPPRVNTRADINLIREVLNELLLIARKCEKGADPKEILPLVWHTLEWLPGAFTPGFRKLLNESLKE